ncbi:MAG: hypothetical protein ACP5F8_01900, partial [Candidatus Aenigmatarchaeota archaeon]
MKGISDVIAMLLMLVITIGLVGLAYSYISGVFTARTAVVLSIVPEASSCTSSNINIVVRNDGTTSASNVAVSIKAPDGTDACSSISPTSINIAPGNITTVTCTRVSGKGMGYYRVVASASSSTAN